LVVAVSSPVSSRRWQMGSPAGFRSSARSRRPWEPTNSPMHVHCATLLEVLLFCSMDPAAYGAFAYAYALFCWRRS
jgi:hypothetical protein